MLEGILKFKEEVIKELKEEYKDNPRILKQLEKEY